MTITLFSKVVTLLLTIAAASPVPTPIKAGAVLEAADESGNRVRIRIDAVEFDPEDKEKEIFLYSVSVYDRIAKSWNPFCAADAKGMAKAIPLSGSWDAAGNHIPSDKLFTFACTAGVLAKCVRWGYKPWKTLNGISLRDHHQACTRMARGDYCGNGTPHTREGTLIDVYDSVGIQIRGDDDDQMRFEAAWSPSGATYIRKARWYETLENLVKECPEKLKGRIETGLIPLKRKEIRERWPASLLFNDSYVRAPETK